MEASRHAWTLEPAAFTSERLDQRVTNELAALGTEIREAHATLRFDITDTHILLAREVATLRTLLKEDLAEQRFELLKWTCAVALAQLLALGAFVTIVLRST